MAVCSVDFEAQSLNQETSITVILPAEKEDSHKAGRPYKTLYLLHGVFGSHKDWLYNSRIRLLAEEKGLAVVMPSGTNGFYVDQPWNCCDYSRFIGEELVNFTRRIFPLSTKREDTFLGGLSMGGYGAIYNGFKYHDVFSAIGALSAALVVNEKLLERTDEPPVFCETKTYAQSCFGQNLKEAVLGEKNPKVLINRLLEEGVTIPRLFMACGAQDSLFGVNLDFVQYLRQKKITVDFLEGPGGHRWDFWDAYVEKFLNWLPL